MKKTLLSVSAASASMVIWASQSTPEPRDQFGALFRRIEAPSQAAIDSPMAILGRALFWDERLSANGKVSCASCHMPEDGSSDRRQFSVDARGKNTSRHSQPIYNSMLQTGELRWTGDRPSGAAQAEGSMTGSMGFENRELALANLAKHYDKASFAAAFPAEESPVNRKNIKEHGQGDRNL